MKRMPALLLLSMLTIGLVACGFQPRGQVPQLADLPGPVMISGVDRYTPLHREIGLQLLQAGVALTDKAEQAQSVLRIRDHHSGRRLFSVDSRNQAAEFELEELLKFVVRHPGQEQAGDEQTVRVLRILYRPDTEVLAREREEQALRDDMRRDLVGRMIRRIQAQY